MTNLTKYVDEAYRLLSITHDAIPDTRPNTALKGLAFAVVNDAASLARKLRSSDIADAADATDQAEAMPIAQAREWLQEMRRSHEAYLKADVEAKLGYADKHRKRIAALDAALTAIDLLAEG